MRGDWGRSGGLSKKGRRRSNSNRPTFPPSIAVRWVRAAAAWPNTNSDMPSRLHGFGSISPSPEGNVQSTQQLSIDATGASKGTSKQGPFGASSAAGRHSRSEPPTARRRRSCSKSAWACCSFQGSMSLLPRFLQSTMTSFQSHVNKTQGAGSRDRRFWAAASIGLPSLHPIINRRLLRQAGPGINQEQCGAC